MDPAPIMLSSYPRAILHLDGDAFFTSVEQAVVPALKGRPVVTGKERGIIACASYEAKTIGIARGMPLWEARERCPELVILPSDYETYGIFSKRMFAILRRFTPIVEEYSIDEAFADVTGMRRVFRGSYEDMALAIQATIHRELGLTVSVGLAPTKSLAKLCSKFRKPAGFMPLPGHEIHHFLPQIALEKVWGFGPNTVELFEKMGLKTAYDFVQRPERWAAKLLGKVGREIWNELRGLSMYKVNPETPAPKATLVKSKTFAPPSADRAFVYAQLVRNVEAAFARAREHRVRPRVLGVVLRRQDFQHEGLEAELNRPTAATLEILPVVQQLFEHVYREGVVYRATLVALECLEADDSEQMDLFEDRVRIETLRRVTAAVDSVNHQYGRRMVRSGATLPLEGKAAHSRDDAPERRQQVLRGETRTQRLAIPRMSVTV
jgi:DNA polymerase-4/DNA polymerase V